MTTKVPAELSSTPSIVDNGNATAITIDSSERVLIGTDSGDSFNSDSMLRLQRTGDRVFMQFKTDADQNSGILFGDVNDDVECAIEYEPANQALTLSTGNNAEAMRITSDGKVGIGDSNPGAKLDVNSGTTNTLAHFHSTDDNGFIELQDDDTIGYIGVQNNHLYIGGAPSNNAQNINIHKTTGDVGIGTTTPNVKFYVAGNDPANYLSVFYHDGNDNNRYGIRMLAGADSGNGQIWMRFDDGDGHVQGYIQHDAGSVVIGQASDERLKENIVDSTLEGINTLKQIQQREFNFKRDETNTTTVGYVAQELETVYPAAVITNTDTSGEGVISPDDDPDNPYKFVAKERLIDVLIKAMQEQQDIIDNLKTRIETLEAG